MNVPDIRKLYNLLGHEGYYSRIGALDCQTKDYREEYCKGLEEIYEWIRPYLGKRNIFISRSAVSTDRTFLAPRCFTVDLDPIREAGAASTDKQHESAIQAGRRILHIYDTIPLY